MTIYGFLEIKQQPITCKYKNNENKNKIRGYICKSNLKWIFEMKTLKQ